MKNSISKHLCLVTSILASSVASGQYFHSDFDEVDLGSIIGLNIDTPNTGPGADSGTISLDTVNAQLDLTANAANLWADREGAPIAWVTAPTVSVGETWYVETQVNMVNDTGGAATYDQAGITFYGGPDGANPGDTENFALLLSDWNAWTAQSLSFTNGPVTENADLTTTDTNIFLRMEITEGGAGNPDIYNSFYKEEEGDPWIQIAGNAIDRLGSFDNSRVGLVLKSHNSNASAIAQFDYLTVDVIPTPIWQTDGNGDWSTPANWNTAVPNAASVEAIFNDVLPLTGPLTATLDVPVTLGVLNLSSAQAITVGGANTLTFDGGGAAVVSATAGSHMIAAPVSLTDPLNVDLASGSAVEISGALTGTTSVTNASAGQLTLSGDLSGHTGSIISDAGSLVVSGTDASDITANAGTLEVSGTGVSDITVATGVTLSGEGSHTGTLNLAADSALSIDPSNGASAFTTGTLSPTAPVTLEFSSSPAGLTDFTVLNYTTYAGTVATDFVNPAYRLTLTDTGTSITGTVAPAVTSTWTAADGDGGFFYWDNGGKANWDSPDSLFYAGDSVTFTDVGVGYVDVAEEVAPASVTFAHTSGNYLVEDVFANVQSISASSGGINVTGDGDVALNVKVTGNTDITHSGAGTLTLGTGVGNDFVGNVVVDDGGTLVVGSNNFLGDAANNITIGTGATLDLNGVNNLLAYDTNSFIFEAGSILTNSGGTLNNAFSDQVQLGGDVTLDGIGRFDIHGAIAVTGSNIVITMENDTGNVISGDNSAQSISEWVVNAGTLIVSNDNALGSAATVTVNANGAIRGNIPQDGVRVIANNITLNGGQLQSGYQNSDTHFTGTIDVATSSVVVPNNNDNDDREIHLLGTLTGAGDLTLDSGTTVIGSTLDASGFTGDFYVAKNYSRNTYVYLEDGVDLTQDIVVVDGAGLMEFRLQPGNSAEISGDITINDETLESFDFNVIDAGDTLTVSGDISGSGAAGVTKTLPGSLILSGVNTYTGSSVIYNGNVTLTASSRTTIVPTTNGVNNQIDVRNAVGPIVNADGELYFDLSGADTSSGNVWQIITGAGAGNVVTGATFSVNSSEGSFTETPADSGVWVLNDWTFNESTGTLSLPSGYGIWAAGNSLTEGVNDGEADDPEFDGIENVLEYILGGDPLVADLSILPEGAINGANYELTFTRSDVSEADATLTVEFGSDLSVFPTSSEVVPATSGTVGSVTFTIIENGDGNDDVTASIPHGGATEFFGRASGSLNP